MPLCVQQVTTIYVDKDIVVVDKPSGLLSVPGKNPLNKDCLITRVQQQYADAQIVHRLDMDTSGVMVLARGKANLSALSRQFQAYVITLQIGLMRAYLARGQPFV